MNLDDLRLRYGADEPAPPPRCPELYNEGRSGKPARCIYQAGHDGPHHTSLGGTTPLDWTC